MNVKVIYFLFLSYILSSSLYADNVSSSCIDLMTDKLIQEEDSTNTTIFNRSLFTDLSLKTQEDKIKALTLVQQDIPELFIESIDDTLDFTTILEGNDSLLSSIRQAIPEYDKILKQRPNLLDIEVTTPSEIQYLDRTTTNDEVKKWVTSLRNSLSFLKKNYPDTTVSEIINKLMYIYTNTLDFNSVLGAIRNIIPNSTVYNKNLSLSFQERIEALSQELPDTFKPGLIKWNIIIKNEELKNSLLSFSDKEKILYILNYQVHLFNLASVVIIKNKHIYDGTNPGDIFEIPFSTILEKTLQYLDTTSTEDLNRIPVAFLEHDLKKLDDSSLVKKTLIHLYQDSKVVDKLSKSISSLARNYLSTKIQIITNPILNLNIKEVSSLSALFRGIVGSDCSTEHSFAYPNDPFERVFFIYNNKNETLGYISGTEILINDKPSFYIHTISGSNLSSYHVKVILDVFNSIKKELAVETISFPILPILQKNITRHEIRSEIKSRLEDNTIIEAVELNYLSKLSSDTTQSTDYIFRYNQPKIRNFISEFKIKHNQGTYDSIDKNYKLRIDNSPLNKGLHINVKERTISNNLLEEFSLDYKKLILSLWKIFESKRLQVKNLKNIYFILNKDEDYVIHLYEDLLNKDKLEINQYFLYIRNTYDLNLDIEELPLESLVRSSDFSTNKNLQTLFIKKIKTLKFKSIYFNDSFDIIVEKIRSLPKTNDLEKNELYKILSNPNYINFYRISHHLIIATKNNFKLDIIKQISDSFFIVEDIDNIEKISNNTDFIIEKNKKFAIVSEDTISHGLTIDLDKIEPITTIDDSSSMFYNNYTVFKVYKNGKCGIIYVSKLNGENSVYPITHLLRTEYDEIEYKVIRNGTNKILEYFEIRSNNKLGFLVPYSTTDTKFTYDKIYVLPSNDNFYIGTTQNGKHGLFVISSDHNYKKLIKKLEPVYDKIEINESKKNVTVYTEGSSFSFRVD